MTKVSFKSLSSLLEQRVSKQGKLTAKVEKKNRLNKEKAYLNWNLAFIKMKVSRLTRESSNVKHRLKLGNLFLNLSFSATKPLDLEEIIAQPKVHFKPFINTFFKSMVPMSLYLFSKQIVASVKNTTRGYLPLNLNIGDSK